MVWIWGKFIFSAFVIIIAAVNLSRNADIIAEKTGLGRVWVGALLLPMVTSLPEIVTSAQAVLVGNIDLALGNVLGSNMFNILIIAVVDLVQGSGPILYYVRPGHILTAAIGILLIGLTVFAVLVGMKGTVPFLGIGYDSLVLLLAFLSGIFLITRYERKNSGAEQDGARYEDKTLGKAFLVVGMAALFIFFSGRLLAVTGDQLSRATGLGGTFVGSFLVAITTSLPELITTMTAVRIGAPDMAIGNILGANVMNIFIVVVSDLLYRGDAILGAVSSQAAVAGVMAMALTAVAIIGLVYKSQKSFLFLGIDAYGIIFLYLVGAVVLYLLGVGM